MSCQRRGSAAGTSASSPAGRRRAAAAPVPRPRSGAPSAGSLARRMPRRLEGGCRGIRLFAGRRPADRDGERDGPTAEAGRFLRHPQLAGDPVPSTPSLKREETTRKSPGTHDPSTRPAGRRSAPRGRPRLHDVGDRTHLLRHARGRGSVSIARASCHWPSHAKTPATTRQSASMSSHWGREHHLAQGRGEDAPPRRREHVGGHRATYGATTTSTRWNSLRSE